MDPNIDSLRKTCIFSLQFFNLENKDCDVYLSHNCVKITISKLGNTEIQYLLDPSEGWLILGKNHIVYKTNALPISLLLTKSK